MRTYYRLIVAFCLTFSPTSASDSDSDTELYPKEISYQIKTAQEFIEIAEEELAYAPDSTLFVVHVEGVLTEEACPNPHHYETAEPCTLLVNYLRKLKGATIVYTSHLFPETETFQRLKDIGLLDKESYSQKGELEIYFKEPHSQKLNFHRNGNCALVRRSKSNIKDQQVCFQDFYYQKAFAPSAVYGTEARWRQIIYLDHSKLCTERFDEDLPYTPPFDALERIVTIQIAPKF